MFSNKVRYATVILLFLLYNILLFHFFFSFSVQPTLELPSQEWHQTSKQAPIVIHDLMQHMSLYLYKNHISSLFEVPIDKTQIQQFFDMINQCNSEQLPTIQHLEPQLDNNYVRYILTHGWVDALFDHYAIVIGIYVGGSNSQDIVAFSKSLFFVRSTPIHLYVLTDKQSSKLILDYLTPWTVPYTKISIVEVDEPLELSPIKKLGKNTFRAGKWSYIPTATHLILKTVPKIILYGSDGVFMKDVMKTWSHFSKLSDKQFIAMATEYSDWHVPEQAIPNNRVPGTRSKFKNAPNMFGVNGHSIVMDLDKMRKYNFDKLVLDACERLFKEFPKIKSFDVGDQDVFVSLRRYYPETMYEMSCSHDAQNAGGMRCKSEIVHYHYNAQTITPNNPNAIPHTFFSKITKNSIMNCPQIVDVEHGEFE